MAGAASFDGASQYIKAASRGYLGINFGPARPFSFCNGIDSACSGNFTIDVWMQLASVHGAFDRVIVDKTFVDSDSNAWGYTFFVNGHNLGLEMADGTSTRYLSPDSIPTLDDGNWHHVAVTVDRLSPGGITFYHNGAPLPTTMNPTARTGSLIGDYGFYGPLLVGVRTSLKDYYHGSLDELEIFNRVLFPNEVKGIYDAQSAGKCKPISAMALASCVPASSQSVLIQKADVTAYVPLGWWQTNTTGIRVVPIEGSNVGNNSTIPTLNPVNSCASNSVTGETVCVANGSNTSNNDVYLITGSNINKTLQSSATAPIGFSGTSGPIFNAGVAINPVRNEAIIEVGTLFGPGLQVLSLSPNGGSYTSFTRLVSHGIAENVQIDPYRDLILSPAETNFYSVVNRATNKLTDYWNAPNNIVGLMDSAAEDCTTGIALSTLEGTTSLYMADLTQASYSTSMTNRTWSAPDTVASFPEFGNMFAGTDGIAVAPGTHLAIVTGEFGGREIGVVALPSSSGTGTPVFVNYVAAYLKTGFRTGNDPHTVTAYVSPSNGRAYGVVANWGTIPTELAIIDLDKLLHAKRCNGTGASKCDPLGPNEVDPQLDLVTAGIVTYVKV